MPTLPPTTKISSIEGLIVKCLAYDESQGRWGGFPAPTSTSLGSANAATTTTSLLPATSTSPATTTATTPPTNAKVLAWISNPKFVNLSDEQAKIVLNQCPCLLHRNPREDCGEGDKGIGLKQSWLVHWRGSQILGWTSKQGLWRWSGEWWRW